MAIIPNSDITTALGMFFCVTDVITALNCPATVSYS